MGIERYELSEGQRERVGPLRPGKAGDPGRTAEDNRLLFRRIVTRHDRLPGNDRADLLIASIAFWC